MACRCARLKLEVDVSEALISPDGQIPLPDDVRERMGLRPGARVQLRLVDDHTLIVESSPQPSVTRLFGMFRAEGDLTLDDMDRAIEEGAAGR